MSELREPVICLPLRTPIGRYGGVLRDLSATQLAAHVIGALVERSGLEPSQVDDVLLGQCYPSGEAPAIGRVAALDAGLPVTVPGLQIDRRCGSALQTVIQASMQVATGASDVVIAGGTESMSQVEFYSAAPRFGARGESVTLWDRLARARTTTGGEHHPVPGGMLETAENLRREYSIGREEQDRLALASHQRAVRARESGAFDDELVPVRVRARGGDVVVDRDEHPRADTTLEKLGSLPPIRVGVDAEATVTAGNAAGQNDGAAVCLVTTREHADRLGLEPLVALRSWAVSGVEPSRMGVGPVPATAKALARSNLTLGDMDLIEVNEAFAVQVLAVTREWNFRESDFERLNVNGSGVSLGHPVGATGTRILATLVYEMRRRDAHFGLETMCIGGGQGLAAVFERAT